MGMYVMRKCRQNCLTLIHVSDFLPNSIKPITVEFSCSQTDLKPDEQKPLPSLLAE